MVANPLFLRGDGRLAPFAGHCFVFVALVTFRKKKRKKKKEKKVVMNNFLVHLRIRGSDFLAR